MAKNLGVFFSFFAGFAVSLYIGIKNPEPRQETPDLPCRCYDPLSGCCGRTR